MTNPSETISSYLRCPSPLFRRYYKGSSQTKSSSGQYHWEDIKAVKDWDAFNESPVRAKFEQLIYEDQYECLVQPLIPSTHQIIASELYLQTSLHIGLLAKVNWALEALTKCVEKREEDGRPRHARILNLGVLPGPRSFNSIPDLVVQNISEVAWGVERSDKDEDEDEEGESMGMREEFEEQEERDGETDEGIHISNLDSSPTTQESGSSPMGRWTDNSISSPIHQPGNSLSLQQATTSTPPPFLLVGDIKLHSGWKHSMWKHLDSRGADFRQVLSQVNFYMTQNGCQYGFVITDREFVAVYRPGRKGLLKVSRSFSIWTREGWREEQDGSYPPSSSARDLCAEEALLALILWAADPPSSTPNSADETCDTDAEEDEFYPTAEIIASSSEGPTSAEKGSVFSPPNSGCQSSSPGLPNRKRVKR